MNKPDFIIAGAAKAGTTTLYKILDEYDSIFFSSVKEPQYFVSHEFQKNRGIGKPTYSNHKNIYDKEEYLKLFSSSKPGQLTGEASTIYLHDQGAARRISEELPDVKLIFCLRNPVERAYSQYLHHVRDRRETAGTFEEGLILEADRIAKNWGPFWSYKKSGLYYEQLVPFFKYFDRTQIKVVFFEEFIRDKIRGIKELLEFLEIKEDLILPQEAQYNKTGKPRSEFLNTVLRNKYSKKFYQKLNRYIPANLVKIVKSIDNQNLVKEDMDSQLRKELTEYYRSDIENLVELLSNPYPKNWLI